MRARLCGSVSGRYRTEENFLLTKHVVAAGTFAKDAGSTPAASTIFPAGKNGAAPQPAFEAKQGEKVLDELEALVRGTSAR